MIYKLPKDFKRFLNYLGHTLTPSLAFAGIVSTIMWLLINNSEYYLTKIHSPALIYSIITIGIVVISMNWYQKMYAAYQSKHLV